MFAGPGWCKESGGTGGIFVFALFPSLLWTIVGVKAVSLEWLHLGGSVASLV